MTVVLGCHCLSSTINDGLITSRMIRKSSFNVLSLKRMKVMSLVSEYRPLTALPSELRKIAKFVRVSLEVVSRQQEYA